MEDLIYFGQIWWAEFGEMVALESDAFKESEEHKIFSFNPYGYRDMSKKQNNSTPYSVVQVIALIWNLWSKFGVRAHQVLLEENKIRIGTNTIWIQNRN